MFAWGGWSAISRPVPFEYQLFDVSPCSGNLTCLESGGRYSDGWPVVVLISLCVIYLVGTFIVQRGLTGRTVGSMLFAFAVVGEDGRPLGIPRALLRSMAGSVDYLPCCLPIVGVVTITATPSNQRVGDLAAGSLVVDTRPADPSSGRSAAIDTHPERIETRGPIAADEQFPIRPPTVHGGAPPQPPGPLWDPSRQAYVLWDEADGCWLRFDDAAQRWVGIDEA